MKNNKKTGAAGRAFLWVGLCIMAAVFVWGAWRAWTIWSEDLDARNAGKTLRSSFGNVRTLEDGSMEISGAILPSPLTDVVAWISIPDTPISYPVLYGKGNDWYLKHLPDGSINRNGSIFMDERNNGSFDEPNTIVHGHRMNSGEMFGQLHRYLDPLFLKEHPAVYLEFPDGSQRRYEVAFAYATDSSAQSPAYAVDFDSQEAFRDWKRGLFQRYGPDGSGSSLLLSSERVLTLSTCVKGDKGKRFILQAVEETADAS